MFVGSSVNIIIGTGGEVGFALNLTDAGKVGRRKSAETERHQTPTFDKMRLIVSIALFAACVSARPSLSLLQPLPKHYDAGDAAVVFIKDRMNVLPEGFGHNKEGTLAGCRPNE
jgi:hypothetical protein